MSDAWLHDKFLRCVATGGLEQSDAQALLRRLADIESAPRAL